MLERSFRFATKSVKGRPGAGAHPPQPSDSESEPPSPELDAEALCEDDDESFLSETASQATFGSDSVAQDVSSMEAVAGSHASDPRVIGAPPPSEDGEYSSRGARGAARHLPLPLELRSFACVRWDLGVKGDWRSSNKWALDQQTHN